MTKRKLPRKPKPNGIARAAKRAGIRPRGGATTLLTGVERAYAALGHTLCRSLPDEEARAFYGIVEALRAMRDRLVQRKQEKPPAKKPQLQLVIGGAS